MRPTSPPSQHWSPYKTIHGKPSATTLTTGAPHYHPHTTTPIIPTQLPAAYTGDAQSEPNTSNPTILSLGGVFAQRAHSATSYVVYPGNTPENHPLTETCMINSKQHQGCRIQDPGTRGKHLPKKRNPWCISRGCRVQNSGPGTRGYRWWKTADFSHSALCAPPTLRAPLRCQQEPNRTGSTLLPSHYTELHKTSPSKQPHTTCSPGTTSRLPAAGSAILTPMHERRNANAEVPCAHTTIPTEGAPQHGHWQPCTANPTRRATHYKLHKFHQPRSTRSTRPTRSYRPCTDSPTGRGLLDKTQHDDPTSAHPAHHRLAHYQPYLAGVGRCQAVW